MTVVYAPSDLWTLKPRAKWAGRLRKVDFRYLVARYEDGDTLREIADDFGTSALLVGRYLKKQGYTRRHTGRAAPLCKLTRSQMDDAATRYRGGESMNALAKEYNVSDTTLKLYLERDGVEARDIASAKRLRWAHRKEINGYIAIRLDESDPYFSMAYTSSFVLEHRYVVARRLGRVLLESESVHHIDGNRANNSVENLQLRQGAHGSGIAMRCNACGSDDVSAMRLPEAA